jgi:alanine dehydrogenase
MLVLDATDVASVWTMPTAVDAMRELCLQEAAGKTLASDRIHIPLLSGFLRILPGVLLESNVLGYKEFHSGGHGMRYSVHLFDLDTGAALAVMDGSNITTVRTGAMGAIALEQLVDSGARTVAVIGSGKEASSALAGLRVVLPRITRGWNYSPTSERRIEFARKAMSHSVTLEAVDSAPVAIAKADVVIAATMTRGGIALKGSWLRAGIHASSISSTAPEQRESDADVWRVADRIVVDTMRLLDESGDAIAAHEDGALSLEKVVTLSDVVAGKAVGRRDEAEVTLYKSVGTGLQDVAAAHTIYQLAVDRGIGREVDPFAIPIGGPTGVR